MNDPVLFDEKNYLLYLALGIFLGIFLEKVFVSVIKKMSEKEERNFPSSNSQK